MTRRDPGRGGRDNNKQQEKEDKMTNPPQSSLEPLPLEMRLRALEGHVGRASDNATPLVTRVEALTTALEDAVAGVPALKQFYDNCECP